MTIELLAGEKIGGKYRIERLIGRGAVGTVYAAEHTETGKRVALKCVNASHAPDPASAERLIREAQAVARIRHANVVDIYDVGRDGNLVFLVMEYLEGEPLSAMIAREGLPVFKLIATLLPAMRGVAEAHRQGVVHRDIKPENIFLARQVDASEPVAKVLDFGISKLDARGSPLRALTADGYAIGTPGYMAYEQAMGDRTLDGRADVYAFGAILYEALTGEVPHTARDFGALVRHFLTEHVVPPSEQRADIPQSLSALVMWTIERDRDERVSSMEALIRELEPFATELGYQREQAATLSPPGGLTLPGPWGLTRKPAPPAKDPARASTQLAGAAPKTPARASTQVPSTLHALLSLKRSGTRSAWLLVLGSALVTLGGVAFAWWSEAQLEAAPEHSVSAATAKPRDPEPDPAIEPTADMPPGAAPPPLEAAPQSHAPTPAQSANATTAITPSTRPPASAAAPTAAGASNAPGSSAAAKPPAAIMRAAPASALSATPGNASPPKIASPTAASATKAAPAAAGASLTRNALPPPKLTGNALSPPKLTPPTAASAKNATSRAPTPGNTSTPASAAASNTQAASTPAPKPPGASLAPAAAPRPTPPPVVPRDFGIY